ncbi:MAG: IS21-like element helper ATPase IstB [Myxococcota bacterium]
MNTPDFGELDRILRGYRLGVLAEELVEAMVGAGHQDALELVAELFEREDEARLLRRVERLLKASRLGRAKTFETLEMERFEAKLQLKINALRDGGFAARAQNVLCFGAPGVGKSHVAQALGHEMIKQGRRVKLYQTFELVQELLGAKAELKLARALRKLDGYEVLIVDDLGYVQQEAGEVEVLFTLMAERYERRSMIITSNLVFSQWDQIFKNEMTTAAAIDRLVHHAVILEFNVGSYRSQQALARQRAEKTRDE